MFVCVIDEFKQTLFIYLLLELKFNPTAVPTQKE